MSRPGSMRHPSEAQLALLAGGDLGILGPLEGAPPRFPVFRM